MRSRAEVRAVANLSSAPKCPVCHYVHMYIYQKHKEVLFPSLLFSSCKKFRDTSAIKHKTYLPQFSLNLNRGLEIAGSYCLVLIFLK